MSRLTFFFFECYGAHRDLHSFPTRRSSDLLDRRERDAEGARLDLVPSRADAELAAPAAQVIDGDRGLREQTDGPGAHAEDQAADPHPLRLRSERGHGRHALVAGFAGSARSDTE